MTGKKNFDSTFCGSLPLHQINFIQPHGALLVLKPDFTIVQVSENVYQFLNLQPDATLYRSISEFIPAGQFKQLKESVENGLKKIPLSLSIKVDQFSLEVQAIVHVKTDMILMEVEQADTIHTQQKTFINVYEQLKYVMSAIDGAQTIDAVCQVAISQLKQLSGFDKIMIYQFDKDWNGKVIAEIMEPGMESYLGLVFPASDIPKQARELYHKNPYRLIPNREYKPVRLYPLINSISSGFLDLSDVGLRGVPAVHLEYLKNMDVMASMSTRILKTNALWGLISCHHREAKYLSYEVCTIFELLSTIISSRIVALESKEEFHYYSDLQKVQAQLIQQVYIENDLISGFINHEVSLLDLLQADGVIIQYKNRMESSGRVPSREEIKDLLLWLKSQNINKVYHEDSLSDNYERAASYADIGSGILVIPINPSREEYIIFFREQVIQKINWGGNPEEAIQFEKNTLNYHPRNSFKIWQQTVAHTSLPWTVPETNVAEQFRNFLLEYVVQHAN